MGSILAKTIAVNNSSGQPQKDSVAFGLGVIVAGNRKRDKLIFPPTSTSQAHPTSTLSSLRR